MNPNRYTQSWENINTHSICRRFLAYLLNSLVYSFILGSTFIAMPGSLLDAGKLEVNRTVLTSRN